MPTEAQPLDGYTVISFEHAIAAPLCTRQLADLGARVIKIERRDRGDFARGYDQRVHEQSSHFVWTNRGKQSLTLDIKQPAAQDIISRLLEQSDVLVENLAPGALQRCGLDYAAVKKNFPQLIYCSISGYGSEGPYSKRKAYDLMIQAESGFLSVTGQEDSFAKSGISIADIAAGSQAHAAILSALLKKLKTGKGSRIEISMLEAMVDWMGYPLYYAYEGQQPPPRTGADHASIYPYGAFNCADDQTLMLGIQNEREWKSFCSAVLNTPELSSDPRFTDNSLRSENREALRTLIQDKLQNQPLEQISQALDSTGIAWARVNTLQQVWQHPQLEARKRFAEFITPGGKVRGTIPATGQQNQPLGQVPALGEQTDSILTELGYSAPEIAAFRNEKVV